MGKRIEYYDESNGSWWSTSCDFENAGCFEDDAEAKTRLAELKEENPDIDFRLITA